MKPPVLLCYNLPPDQSGKIRLLAMRLGVRIRVVLPTEYGEPLVSLCGWEPLTGAPVPQAAFVDEMLVLANFSNAVLSAFLEHLRQGKTAPVSLKAILTDTNMHWDSVTLHAELSQERDALAAAKPPVHSDLQT